MQPRNQLVHERFAAAEERGILCLERGESLVRARGTGRDRMEPDAARAGSVGERSQGGSLPLRHARITALGLGRETTRQNCPPGGRHRRELSVQLAGTARHFSGEKVPQHARRAENIGFRADILTSAHLLGRTEVRRATDDRRPGRRALLVLGEPEIADRDSFVIREQSPPLLRRISALWCRGVVDDQQISRLDVTMDDAGAMECTQPSGECGDRRAHPLLVDGAPRTDALGEHATVRQVHDEVRASVGGLADVVDRDDVRAADAAKQLRLANEALARHRVACVFGREDLDGNMRVERFVERAHDDPETADTENGTHSIPADRLGQAVHDGGRARTRGERTRRDS